MIDRKDFCKYARSHYPLKAWNKIVLDAKRNRIDYLYTILDGVYTNHTLTGYCRDSIDRVAQLYTSLGGEKLTEEDKAFFTEQLCKQLGLEQKL